MRYTFVILILIFPLLAASACEKDKSVENAESDAVKNDTMSYTVKITVAGKTYTAKFPVNETTKAFKSMLPLKVVMADLNGNEKFCPLPNNLPVNASNPGTIKSGDLMLYGSNTLVLFYETFPTSYSYTRLGKIDNPSGLASTLGSGSVTVEYMHNQVLGI
jgi:hypothetical protein